MDENGDSENVEEMDYTYSDQYQMLIDTGLDQTIAENLYNLYVEGVVAPEELDQRALGALRDLDVESANTVINEMRNSDLQSVTNKSAYMCGLMKACRQKMAAGINPETGATGKPGPNNEKMREILERTGYSHEVTMGQRKYGGPPPNWEGPQPGAGFEVFCGKIPQTIFEDTLIPMFEKCGTIWDLRLMLDPVTGYNKSFCFVTFVTKEGAQNAVKQLDGFEIKPGKKLKVNISVANVRLFVGNLPKHKSKDELKAEFSKIVEGLTDVIVYTNPNDPGKRNRGFAFLEFDSHKAAGNARRKLSSSRLFGVEIIVSWAEPQEEPDDEIMSKVKILYIRNLKADVTEDDVMERFLSYGPIERVKKFKDYCFVHFEERDHAVKAMNELNKTVIKSSEMLITLAKPPAANKQQKKQFVQQQPHFGLGSWAQPAVPALTRGRGRGRARARAAYGGYSVAAAAETYDPYYGYEGGYDYSEYEGAEYEYDDTDYYGGYGYSTAVAPVPVVYPVVRPRARGRILPVRGIRPTVPVPLVRGATRGVTPRLVVPAARGIARARLPRGMVRAAPRGRVLPVPRGRGQLRAMKRKAPDGAAGGPEPKRLMELDEWETQPIVQQPLASTEDEWYQDSWA